MRVRFWGVRGSIPCPGPTTIRYGGNTPCIEVRCGERILIFDAGTGLRSLGIELLKDNKIRDIDIFITHCHLDHVSGLPFFAPFFREDYRVRVWAGNLTPSNSIEHVMRKLMSSPWFPVPMDIFRAKMEFRDFKSGEVLRPHRGRRFANRVARSSGRHQRLPSRIRWPSFGIALRHRRISPANATPRWSRSPVEPISRSTMQHSLKVK